MPPHCQSSDLLSPQSLRTRRFPPLFSSSGPLSKWEPGNSPGIRKCGPSRSVHGKGKFSFSSRLFTAVLCWIALLFDSVLTCTAGYFKLFLSAGIHRHVARAARTKLSRNQEAQAHSLSLLVPPCLGPSSFLRGSFVHSRVLSV